MSPHETMFVITFSLFVIFNLQSTCIGASTKEVFLDNEMGVKRDASQTDLNQFFQDQPHLVGALTSVSSNESRLPLSVLLQQLAENLDPIAFSQFIIYAPMQLWLQLFDSNNRSNQTLLSIKQ